MISVRVFNLNEANPQQVYMVMMECEGVGEENIRWGIAVEEPVLGCDDATSATFTIVINDRNIVVTLLNGIDGEEMYIRYRLVFRRMDAP